MIFNWQEIKELFPSFSKNYGGYLRIKKDWTKDLSKLMNPNKKWTSIKEKEK